MCRNVSRFIFLLLLAAGPASAQTNMPAPANAAAEVATATNETFGSAVLRAERVRAECIRGRRTLCGKILLVLPAGLVVESGYTNLLREPLTRSWLVPGTVSATRAQDQVESHEPGSPCFGTVFLTDLPRKRGPKPKRYDYVIIEGYPAGHYTYTSLGTIHKTVRRFSAELARAVELNLQSETNAAPSGNNAP
jgi:hypothetical protein